jgi:protein-disulfide isomerase
MHAAVDANCLAAQSAAGYWNYVDYLHAHADAITGEKPDLAKTITTLDKLMLEEGGRQHVNTEALKACGDKQDQTAVRAFIKEGDVMGVDATPTMYLNGGKLDGAMDEEEFWKKIDGALLAMGITPPPEPVRPAKPAAKPTTQPAQKPAAK